MSTGDYYDHQQSHVSQTRLLSCFCPPNPARDPTLQECRLKLGADDNETSLYSSIALFIGSGPLDQWPTLLSGFKSLNQNYCYGEKLFLQAQKSSINQNVLSSIMQSSPLKCAVQIYFLKDYLIDFYECLDFVLKQNKPVL